jgi:hypothetical protein
MSCTCNLSAGLARRLTSADWSLDATGITGVSRGASLDPDNVRNYTNVAGCLINMNRFDEAREATAGATTELMELLWINLYSTRASSKTQKSIAWCGVLRSARIDRHVVRPAGTEAYYGRLKKAREFHTRARVCSQNRAQRDSRRIPGERCYVE